MAQNILTLSGNTPLNSVETNIIKKTTEKWKLIEIILKVSNFTRLVSKFTPQCVECSIYTLP